MSLLSKRRRACLLSSPLFAGASCCFLSSYSTHYQGAHPGRFVVFRASHFGGASAVSLPALLSSHGPPFGFSRFAFRRRFRSLSSYSINCPRPPFGFSLFAFRISEALPLSLSSYSPSSLLPYFGFSIAFRVSHFGSASAPSIVNWTDLQSLLGN